LLFVEREFLKSAEQVRSSLPRLRQVVAMDAADDRGAGFVRWKAGHPDGDLEPTAGPEDAVVQIYTSGTTGLPKGVVLANKAFFTFGNAMIQHDLDWMDWQPTDVSLIALPAFQIAGL